MSSLGSYPIKILNGDVEEEEELGFSRVPFALSVLALEERESRFTSIAADPILDFEFRLLKLDRVEKKMDCGNLQEKCEIPKFEGM